VIELSLHKGSELICKFSGVYKVENNVDFNAY